MPLHCDSLDGPVVTAARDALTAVDVEMILPYVPADGEDEVRDAFARILPLHTADSPGRGRGPAVVLRDRGPGAPRR